jgi:hypothetical protein
MPNLSAHMGIAKDAASRLNNPLIDRHMGALLLGSVSPDIRIITKGQRYDTHFVQLDFQSVGDGLDGLFHTYPNLAKSDVLTDPTRAFVVGYVSHLFADELWIIDMYRPFFGNRDVFQDSLRGDLMDRALQLELDRREQLALGGLATLHPLMVDAEKDVDIGFISSDSMGEWRQWVEDALDWSFNWDRLRFMARRVAARNNDKSQVRLDEIVEEFLQSVPQGLERIYQSVPVERFDAFREKSIEHILSFAQEYLN